MTPRIRVAGGLAIVLLLSSAGRADVYTIDRESGYDNIVNGLLTNGTGKFGGQCASTSMTNSFLYLQEMYPKIYGTKLTTENGAVTPTQARDDLDASVGGVHRAGNYWNAKVAWVNKYASGTTTFSAITMTGAKTPQGKSYKEDRDAVKFDATPQQMWTWLTQQIKAGEDVELGIFDHMTTVMGYAIDTTNDKMYLEIIDPNAPRAGGGVGPGTTSKAKEGEWVSATFTRDGIMLGGFSVKDYEKPYIYYMFAESPIPEPSTLTLMTVAALTGIVGWVSSAATRRRSTAAALHRPRAPRRLGS